MNRAVFIILLFSCMVANGQTHLKLIDSYSFDVVHLDSSIQIKKADYSLDTINNIISLHRVRGSNLEIIFRNYEFYSEKVNIRKLKNDTISRQLIPIDSVIISRFESKWKTDSVPTDTLIFDNLDDLKTHILSYLKYLKVLYEYCDMGMCNYSNTFRYKINFSKVKSGFEINSIEKLQPLEYDCEELTKYINKLKIIFPRFRIKEVEKGDFGLYFTLMN